ncbi:anaerobic ribonucleoside-triphosphate reductase activating protein [Spirochaetia bacterium]|nr:anaerobic ribonucleoside-triphosphate reductase activating protein [Spirochaetia bacterium]
MFTDAEDAESDDIVSLEAALTHIEKRKNVLGGVVLSGGEPTLYDKLPQLIREIKTLKSTGVAVKLDTNGTMPEVLESLFSNAGTRPDYIACDLKLSPQRYAQLGGAAESLAKSVELIKSSCIEHEFRSLVLPPDVFSEKDITDLAPLAESSRWVFRPFKPASSLPADWQAKTAATAADVKKAVAFAHGLGANAVDPGL